MSRLRLLLASAGALGAASLAVPSAAGAVSESVSDNWAGYAVTGRSFERVSGSWTVPKVRCTAGHKRYSAAWAGLGGFRTDSQSLEQIGTVQNCTSSGRSSYWAWYELVPADLVRLKLKVRAGDKVSASVTVSGTRVKLTLRNRTTKKSYSATKHMSSPDVSSAEWILEAPSSCDDHGCSTLPLANFGTAKLGSAVATPAGGKARAISKSNWSIQRLVLNDPAGGAASTSGLSSDGRSFKISYRQQSQSKRLHKASRGGPGRR
jgi:Peptidase A4 family